MAFALVAQPRQPTVGMLAEEPSCCQVCVQVAVPDADMEELLPAARLLSRATAVTPGDYEQAKGVFLQGLQNAGAQAEVRPRRPVLRLGACSEAFLESNSRPVSWTVAPGVHSLSLLGVQSSAMLGLTAHVCPACGLGTCWVRPQ